MVGRLTDDNWGRRAVLAENLAATARTPLPQRLLPDHCAHTRQDQMSDAKVEAYFQAFLALVGALPEIGFLNKQLGLNSDGGRHGPARRCAGLQGENVGTRANMGKDRMA